jgi:hypothetical protein
MLPFQVLSAKAAKGVCWQTVESMWTLSPKNGHCWQKVGHVCKNFPFAVKSFLSSLSGKDMYFVVC